MPTEGFFSDDPTERKKTMRALLDLSKDDDFCIRL